MKKLRVLFFGTPQLSADILDYLSKQNQVEVVGVVTNPDTVGGRGHDIQESPVAKKAKEKNMILFRPEKLKDEKFLEVFRALSPDIGIVVAYGKILPQVVLDIPRHGFINLHSSLLPKYRGAAPIQQALLDGAHMTGLTVMQLNAGMDEGDILLQEEWILTPEDTTGTLYEKKGRLGGPLIMQALNGIENGNIIAKKQNHAEATYTKKIEKKDGELQFSWTPEEVYHRWQAYTPWPGLFTFYNDIRVGLIEIEKSSSPLAPGEWSIIGNLPALGVNGGALRIKRLHPAGKKVLTGEEFIRGYMKN